MEEPAAVGPSCPVHPEMPAPTTCGRCGRFVCATCVPDLTFRSATVTCPDCVSRQEYTEAATQVPRLLRSLPIWFGGVALFYLGIGGVLVVLSRASLNANLVGIVCVLAALGILGMLVALIRTKDAGWGWGAIAFMGVIPIASLIVSDGTIRPGILGVALIARLGWGVMKLQGYQRTLKERDGRNLAAATSRLAERPTQL